MRSPAPDDPVARARLYFGVQAAAGAAWWISVFVSDDVRRWTLGAWSPGLLVGPDVVLFVGASALAAALGRRVFAVVAAAWTAAITTALVAHALVDRQAGWGALAMTVATVGTAAATATLWFRRLPMRWFFAGPFRFRVAKPGSRRGHLARSLAQLVVFWTVFFLALPFVLTAVEDRLRLTWPALDDEHWNVIGAALLAAGSVVGIWACFTMALRGEGTPLPADTARHLVVLGPYRFVRNPMAVAGAVQTVGVGLWFGSWLVVASAVAGAAVWNTFIRPVEEEDLARRFGDEYVAYRDSVRCWIP